MIPGNLVTWTSGHQTPPNQRPQAPARDARRATRSPTNGSYLIPIIDLFAGPGGLNEGFSRLGESEGQAVFKTIGSFEMESSACDTLRLRGAYRYLLRAGGVPEVYYRFIRGEISWDRFSVHPEIATALRHSYAEVHQIELGEDRAESDQLISAALSAHAVGPDDKWVLIGGPPCQAYSLAGRSRRAKDADFENDKKHFLYREYLHIIKRFAPPVFVMENVKGLLSSTNSGNQMFDMIKADLENPRDGLSYEIHSLTEDGEAQDFEPRDFIIRSEDYGVPQRRHRVILLGVRKDLAQQATSFGKLVPRESVSVRDAIGGMPKLRSGVSPVRADSAPEWYRIRRTVEQTYLRPDLAPSANRHAADRGSAFVRQSDTSPNNLQFAQWVSDANLDGCVQHSSRSHMVEDLKRYWYAANRAAEIGVSPKLSQFPNQLLPKHKNATSESRPFEDRFRVQLWDHPSTTVVSHIAKDGHYYIHPDAEQMRSLTVREAARLQSFPDNYFFRGNRTQQYHQVGNAVPPLLANQIAEVVHDLLKTTKLAKVSSPATNG